jgi:hypothetical protein
MSTITQNNTPIICSYPGIGGANNITKDKLDLIFCNKDVGSIFIKDIEMFLLPD